MTQMLLQAENKMDLRPFAQIARKQGIVVRYIVQREAKSKNPSPSGDTWFEDPKNLAEIDKGVQDLRNGRFTAFKTKKELHSFLDSL